MTSFPNLVGEESIKDASESISTYKPLLSVVCSEQLKFFLCSVYFPMCNEKLSQPIGPCRPLCLSVKEKCLPILQGFGFSWPDVIRCDKFPLENNRDKMCMKGPNEQGTIQDERAKQLDSSRMEDDDLDIRRDRHHNFLKPSTICPTGEVYINKTSKCVPLCGSNAHAISQIERESATKLLLFLASSSIILTFLSIFIVFISKFGVLGTPTEISMFFSSIAFSLSSLIYIFSVSFREQISCTDYTHHLLFIVGGMYHAPCSSIATLIYYFSTTARLWWIYVSFSWNKSTRNVEESSARLQMIIWGVPLAPLMLALLAKSISANPLTGICLVGMSNDSVDWMFNFCRDLTFFILSTFSIFSSCCRLLGSTSHSETSDINGYAGIIAAVYPISSLVYMLAFINEASQPYVGWGRSFNMISSIKYTIDMILSIFMCALCFIYLLSRVARSPNSKAAKGGYQPAVPKLPTPAIPGSVRSNTYASTFRNPNLI